jgi:hypothetical protein
MLLHALEVVVWAHFYMWQNCFTSRETAYYYSLMSYTTVGYGDVVIASPWRLMGGMEAMAGVLVVWVVHGLPGGLCLPSAKCSVP